MHTLETLTSLFSNVHASGVREGGGGEAGRQAGMVASYTNRRIHSSSLQEGLEKIPLRRDESSPNFSITPFGHGAPVQCWATYSAAAGKIDFGFSDLEI